MMLLLKAEGWTPVDLTGYADFNLLMLLIPAGLFLLGLASGFLPKSVPFKAVLGVMLAFVMAAGGSFYYIWYHEPQQKVLAVESQFVEWFDENHSELQLSEEEKLELLYSPFGFLDREAKKHYILAPVDGSEDYYLQYIGEDNLYNYKPVNSESVTS